MLYVRESAISPSITSPEQAYAELKDIGMADQETFWILGLNQQNAPLIKEMVSMGGLSSAIVDPRVIFKRLLKAGCSSFICAHNHPSGDCTPSQDDKDVTRRLKECGELLGIKLIDHLVIGDGFERII